VEEGSAIGVKPAPAAPAVGDLRAGIVGTGFIGRVHARSARVAGAQVTGVAASSPESATAAAEEIGAGTAFASADALIASEQIDVVHICTPNHLHVPLALAALAAGKHIVCEKPVALDPAGAAQLIAAASDAGRVATVPFVYRYYPTVREARARIRSDGTGDLRLVHGGYLQDWLLGADDDNWRVDAGLGGASRAFADIGSHWCDLIEFVTGERISALIARTAIAHPRR
jgi:predicted dehydrogenase